jgi:hypothetical protein
MEAVCTSETSVNFNVTTLQYIPEASKLHIMTSPQVADGEDSLQTHRVDTKISNMADN